MKLKKTIELPSGTRIPAGTELDFSIEGFSEYNGEEVNIYGIPTHAIEMGMESTINNEIDPADKWLPFADVKIGDKAVNALGEPGVVLGKGIGIPSFAELNKQFDCKGSNLALIINGLSEVELKDVEFIVIQLNESKDIQIDLYGQDKICVFKRANNAEEPEVLTFEEVTAGDTAIGEDGMFKVYDKGIGRKWAERVAKEQGLTIDLDEIDEDAELVLGAFALQPVTILAYGETLKVMK